MAGVPPHVPLLAAWAIGFLSARLSVELASAANALAWGCCALLLLRTPHLAAGMRLSLGGLAATLLGAIWLVESYGVADPHSALTWVTGWGAPMLAGFTMARCGEARMRVQSGLAHGAALVGLGTVALWLAGAPRASFLFSNPNVTAAVLVGCLPLAFAVGEPRRRALLAVAMALGLAATGSRGGMLAAGAMIGAWVVLRRADKRVWLVATAAALLIVPFAAQRLVRLSEDPYAQGRALWWRAALRVNRSQPHGVGTRQFGWYGLRQREEVRGPVYRYLRGQAGESAHSEWIQLLVDHGPVAPLLLLLAAFASLSARPWRLEHAALLGLLLHAAVDGSWQSEVVRLLLLSHAMALWKSRPALPWHLPATVGLGLIGVCAAAALPAGLAQLNERSALRTDRLAARQGKVQPSSIQSLGRAAMLSPLDPDPLAHKARILARVGRWDEAQQAIEQAVHRAPVRPQLRRQTAEIYRLAMAKDSKRRGHHAQRRVVHQRAAVRLQSMHAVDRIAYAEAAVALGYPERARRQVRVALQLEPNHRMAWLALAALEPLEAAQHLEEAERIRTKILKRYCPKARDDCRNHLKRVMTRLELRLLGALVRGSDVKDMQERFGTWPRPALAPWPEG